jgi:hypothetical protein
VLRTKGLVKAVVRFWFGIEDALDGFAHGVDYNQKKRLLSAPFSCRGCGTAEGLRPARGFFTKP